MKTKEKIVPDTSVIIEGILSKNLKEDKLKTSTIIIHEAVLAELEHQANQGKAISRLGLDEIKNIREICKEKSIEIIFTGKRPNSSEIKYADLGEVDAMIRNLAYDEDATLITGDNTQFKVAEAKGIDCILISKQEATKSLSLEKFFDKITMSVHLRENTKPTAKKGLPGQWDFEIIDKNKSSRQQIQDIAKEIIEEARIRSDGFIEIEREGSTIVQLGKFRIVITNPPFADGWEITAVRPVKQTTLEDYNLSEKLIDRFSKQAEGILIAGPPGMGKSTFAAALFRFYQEQGKIVKTVEAPRDLILPEEITQYAISHGSSQEVHDILLLSRPDYTLFDEMRNKEDFELFSDLRLSGIGLAGVIHATKSIDAIQRFVGKIELGVIPHVVDTVVFIKNGQVDNVLSLKMTVKVPSGMTEDDLARPIVVVDNFETGKQEFELYSYGEETVVVPVQEQKKGENKPGLFKLAQGPIESYFRQLTTDVEVEVTSQNRATVKVPEYSIPGIIGRQGKHIAEIEEDLGIKIDIEELKDYKDKKQKNKKNKGKRNKKRR